MPPCGQACWLAEAARRWCPVARETWINNTPLPHLLGSLLPADISHRAFNSHHTPSGRGCLSYSPFCCWFQVFKAYPFLEKLQVFKSEAGETLTERRGKQRLGTDRAGAGREAEAAAWARRRAARGRAAMATERCGASGGTSGDLAGRGGKPRAEAAETGTAGRPAGGHDKPHSTAPPVPWQRGRRRDEARRKARLSQRVLSGRRRIYSLWRPLLPPMGGGGGRHGPACSAARASLPGRAAKMATPMHRLIARRQA